MNSATWRSQVFRVFALLSALAVPAAALALVATLPRAPAAERIASAALAEIPEARFVRSVETLPGQTLRSSCRTLDEKRSLIVFSNGVVLRLVNRRVVLVHPQRLRPQPLRSLYTMALLAECPNSLSLLLRSRLVHSFRKRDPAYLHLRARGADTYVIRLRRRNPSLELELRRDTLDPIGIVVGKGRQRAQSRLTTEGSPSPQRRKPA